jgi:hypothetical protein
MRSGKTRSAAGEPAVSAAEMGDVSASTSAAEMCRMAAAAATAEMRRMAPAATAAKMRRMAPAVSPTAGAAAFRLRRRCARKRGRGQKRRGEYAHFPHDPALLFPGL